MCAEFDKAFLAGASQRFATAHDKRLYERYRRMDGITFEMAGQLQSDQYIGRSSGEIREAFEVDWKKAGAVFPELARQEKSIAKSQSVQESGFPLRKMRFRGRPKALRSRRR